MSFDLSVLQDRRTATAFTAANPTPLNGQLCIESDTGRAKVGDGSTAYAALSYMALSGDERRSADDVYAAQRLSDGRDDTGGGGGDPTSVLVGGGLPFVYGNANSNGEFNADSLTTASVTELAFSYQHQVGSAFRWIEALLAPVCMISLTAWDDENQQLHCVTFRSQGGGSDDGVNQKFILPVDRGEGTATLVPGLTYFLCSGPTI